MAEALPGRARRPLDRHAVRPAARPRWSRRSPARAPSAATRRRSAPRPTARRRPGGWPGASASRSTPPTWRRASAPRSSSPACRSGCGCATRPRHGALPGDQLPHLRDGSHAGGLPGGALPRPRRHRPADAARALCLWVNVPGNPTGELADLGAAAAWGRDTACRCCPTSATSSSPGTGRRARSSSTAPRACSPCTRCRSGPTSPAPAPASTPATPSSSATSPRCASTPASWCPVRCRRPPWRRGPTTPTSTSSASATGARLDAMATALAKAGVDVAVPAGAFYLWAPAPDGDAWALARRLAETGGALVSPGEFYGPGGRGLRAGGGRPARRPHRPRGRAPRRLAASGRIGSIDLAVRRHEVSGSRTDDREARRSSHQRARNALDLKDG